MTLVCQGSLDPTEYGAPEVQSNAGRFLTKAGTVRREKVANIEGRYVYWLGFAYTVTHKRAYAGFYPTLSEAVAKASSLGGWH